MRIEVCVLLGIALLFGGLPSRAENPCVGAAPFETYALGGDESGIGGTGLADPDGIGGTGRGDESGIGGTGIYGTVTAFGTASIAVTTSPGIGNSFRVAAVITPSVPSDPISRWRRS